MRKKTARPFSASPSRRISSPIGGKGAAAGHLGQRQDLGRLRRGPGDRGEVMQQRGRLGLEVVGELAGCGPAR